MTQKRFKKLLMAIGARRNLANETAKKLQSGVQNRASTASDYYTYEDVLTDVVNTLELLETMVYPIPIELMTRIRFTEGKPTIGRKIHILRGLMEEDKRRNKKILPFGE